MLADKKQSNSDKKHKKRAKRKRFMMQRQGSELLTHYVLPMIGTLLLWCFFAYASQVLGDDLPKVFFVLKTIATVLTGIFIVYDVLTIVFTFGSHSDTLFRHILNMAFAIGILVLLRMDFVPTTLGVLSHVPLLTAYLITSQYLHRIKYYS